MLGGELDNPRRPLAGGRRDVEDHLYIAHQLLEAAGGDEAARLGVVLVDAPPDPVPVERKRLTGNSREQRRADPAAPCRWTHSHHSEAGVRHRRTGHVADPAAAVEQGRPGRRPEKLGGHSVARLDVAVDGRAGLEVRFGLRRADHPDLFSFPCCFA